MNSFRSFAFVALATCCAAPTWAGNDDFALRIRPAPTPRHAGVLHLSSGTWTRKATAASIGADTIYDNTCPTGYYSPLSGDTYVDEGRVPSPTAPNNLQNKPGCAASYRVDGFQIAYCTDAAVMGTYSVRFFERYAACTSVIGVPPTAAFDIVGLPGAPTAGVPVCWVVDIDLASPPALSFAMAADGNGGFDGPPANNLFGWSMATSTAGVATGPFIAGDFSVCDGYDGTRWDPVVNYAEAGTGMSTLDQFRIEGGPTMPMCYVGHGNPFASFHLELYADACPPASPGFGYCFALSGCPCNNNTGSALAGCRSSIGLGARLRADGVASLSADSIVLRAFDMPSTTTALFFQGTQRVNGGSGAVFGDGLRCSGGAVIRFGTKTASGGGAVFPESGDPSVSTIGAVTTAGVRDYQVWYRNPASFCTPAVFNLSNGWEIAWAP